ncbi:MAG: alpha/beta hydrolase family protein [Armatimonadota bacterium]
MKQVSYLYLPPGAGSHPVIVFNHGSRMGQERVAMRWEDRAERIAAKGYVVLVPERRGYGASDGSPFSEATRAADGSLDSALFAPRMIAEAGDVLASLALLRQRSDVEMSRLFICGRSLGGIVTVLCAGSSTAFRAGCSMCAAALTWEQSPHIQQAMLDAARKTTIPMLLLQAHTDKSLAPTFALAQTYRETGIRFGCSMYPSALPNDHAMAGAMGGQWRWVDDMLEFFAWIEAD